MKLKFFKYPYFLKLYPLAANHSDFINEHIYNQTLLYNTTFTNGDIADNVVWKYF
jgi:hypothetical protein